MRVRHKTTGDEFRVVINHHNGYEFEGSPLRYNKMDYDILPEPDLLMGMTEEEYLDAYGFLPNG